MSTHTTPPSHADPAEPEAVEPSRRASRFDERGIALQTIIIMVVLLAIAASVAAVLFQRAGQETARLEGSGDLFVYAIGTRVQCRSLGHTWTDVLPTGPAEMNVKDALNTTKTLAVPTGTLKHGDTDATNYYISGYCKP